jgi:pyruvate dehydrogenase E1 component alpha subunit
MTGVRDAGAPSTARADARAGARGAARADGLPLDRARARLLLTDMVLARRASERLWNLQRQGRVTTVTPIAGHEAAIVGVARALDLATDWIVPYYRELLGLAALGDDYLASVVAYWRGHPDGGRAPASARVLPPQISLASQVPHAAGLAWGLRLRGEPGAVCAFIGDGATSEGDFYEGLNLAGVQCAPLVVVVLNNGWAISTPASRQTHSATFAAKADAVGALGLRVDGNDVLTVLDAATRARAHAIDHGPVVLELVTYRMGAHTNSDDPTRYVPEHELDAWRSRDPIEQLRLRLAAGGEWSDADDQAVLDEVAARVERIVDAVIDAPVDPRAAFDHVVARDTARLAAQRRDLVARLHDRDADPSASGEAPGGVSWRP